jgi:hypothetical protein
MAATCSTQRKNVARDKVTQFSIEIAKVTITPVFTTATGKKPDSSRRNRVEGVKEKSLEGDIHSWIKGQVKHWDFGARTDPLYATV